MIFQLNRGRVTVIDAVDLPIIREYHWRVDYHKGRRYSEYAVSTTHRICIYMHRLLLGVVASGVRVAHLNGDGLDNRRRNLRVCNAAECEYKQQPQRKGTSRYKGVYFDGMKYQAYCHPPGCKQHLGSFADERDAAMAYDVAVREMYGELARTNF